MSKSRVLVELELLQKLSHLGDVLEGFKKYIDFRPWQMAADKAVPRGQGKQGGRPPFPTLLMVKILFLKYLYNLSDDKLEFLIADRRSFRRFLDLEETSTTPDAKTIANYNHSLAQAQVGQAFFDEALSQVSRAGYIARGGQLIDASMIPAPISRITGKARKQIESGEIPKEWSEAKVRQHDRDARWVKKNKQSYFGY